MINLTIGENEGNQRLDRFLKKYFAEATLSYIYKLIRKDIKVNGKRVKEDFLLTEGDLLSVYMSDEEAQRLQKKRNSVSVRKQFKVVFEDDNILVVDKPMGLLTHGDGREKKNHLTNQVISYLIDKGEYLPRAEKTFVPSPINRIDRNTTGLVIFGKNAAALQEGSRLMRDKSTKPFGETPALRKFYLTIVYGRLERELTLKGFAAKNSDRNMVSLSKDDEEGAKEMVTVVRPLESETYKGLDFTLAEVEIVTGRTHQIRLHLASEGHALIGDVKYGNARCNRTVKDSFQLSTQLLHSYKLEFGEVAGVLESLRGKTITAMPPMRFFHIAEAIFGGRHASVWERLHINGCLQDRDIN